MASSFKLNPATTVGTVTLAVADLPELTNFYQKLIGLTLLEQTAGTATLGAGETPIVRLVARPEGKSYRRAPGLFHLAILLPSRLDLAHWLQHLAGNQYRLDGVGDHLVSEALYLSDPEGNGIEMYRDRPRETWEHEPNGRVKMATLGIDVQALLADAPSTPFSGLPAGTTLGHVHLQVNDDRQAIDFYREVMGFDLMTTYPGAGFLSAGGYHHHLGVNTWNSKGAAPAPAGSLGLVSYRVVLPNNAAREALLAHLETRQQPIEAGDEGPIVTDPAGNKVVLTVAG